MHRLERLINLLAALLEADRPLSAEELRQRLPGYPAELGSFRRAFERDKESLRDLGVPVSVEAINPAHPGIVGYRVPKEDYYLPDLGLDDDELAALHLAASMVRFGEGDTDGDGLAAFWKLGGTEDRVDAENASVASLPAPAELPALFSAISARRSVGFDYRGRSRRIDPYRLSFRNGQWYLLGLDNSRDEQRWFRLDR
ncbi:MAG: helix-turn-helix transcriptional regulator, partial [Pseudonocardiaceae bacterium]